MDEKKLLAALVADRKSWDSLRKYLRDEDFSDRGQIIYEEIKTWYQRDDTAPYVDKQILLDNICRKHSKHAEVWHQIIRGLEPVSVPNLVDAYIDVRLESLRNRMLAALASGGKDAGDLISEYQQLKADRAAALNNDTKIFTNSKSSELVESMKAENLIPLYPRPLNDAVEGGVPRGTHIFVFAPPEVGKTALCINMGAGFCHAGKRVLYLGNEDPAPMMLLRFKSRLSGMTRQEILANPDKADALAEKNGFGNLVFCSAAPGTMRDVWNLTEEFKPDVLMVDQITNLHTPNLTKIEAYEWVAKQMRNIGKAKDIVVVSVAQAADSAINKLHLEMGDVYFSNIAIQAQADLMIGIGMDHASQLNDTRVLSLCKNKITGNHIPVEVSINRQLSKLTAIGGNA